MEPSKIVKIPEEPNNNLVSESVTKKLTELTIMFIDEKKNNRADDFFETKDFMKFKQHPYFVVTIVIQGKYDPALFKVEEPSYTNEDPFSIPGDYSSIDNDPDNYMVRCDWKTFILYHENEESEVVVVQIDSASGGHFGFVTDANNAPDAISEIFVVKSHHLFFSFHHKFEFFGDSFRNFGGNTSSSLSPMVFYRGRKCEDWYYAYALKKKVQEWFISQKLDDGVILFRGQLYCRGKLISENNAKQIHTMKKLKLDGSNCLKLYYDHGDLGWNRNNHNLFVEEMTRFYLFLLWCSMQEKSLIGKISPDVLEFCIIPMFTVREIFNIFNREYHSLEMVTDIKIRGNLGNKKAPSYFKRFSKDNFSPNMGDVIEVLDYFAYCQWAIRSSWFEKKSVEIEIIFQHLKEFLSMVSPGSLSEDSYPQLYITYCAVRKGLILSRYLFDENPELRKLTFQNDGDYYGVFKKFIPCKGDKIRGKVEKFILGSSGVSFPLKYEEIGALQKSKIVEHIAGNIANLQMENVSLGVIAIIEYSKIVVERKMKFLCQSECREVITLLASKSKMGIKGMSFVENEVYFFIMEVHKRYPDVVLPKSCFLEEGTRSGGSSQKMLEPFCSWMMIVVSEYSKTKNIPSFTQNVARCAFTFLMNLSKRIHRPQNEKDAIVSWHLEVKIMKLAHMIATLFRETLKESWDSINSEGFFEDSVLLCVAKLGQGHKNEILKSLKLKYLSYSFQLFKIFGDVVILKRMLTILDLGVNVQIQCISFFTKLCELFVNTFGKNKELVTLCQNRLEVYQCIVSADSTEINYQNSVEFDERYDSKDCLRFLVKSLKILSEWNENLCSSLQPQVIWNLISLKLKDFVNNETHFREYFTFFIINIVNLIVKEVKITTPDALELIKCFSDGAIDFNSFIVIVDSLYSQCEESSIEFVDCVLTFFDKNTNVSHQTKTENVLFMKVLSDCKNNHENIQSEAMGSLVERLIAGFPSFLSSCFEERNFNNVFVFDLNDNGSKDFEIELKFENYISRLASLVNFPCTFSVFQNNSLFSILSMLKKRSIGVKGILRVIQRIFQTIDTTNIKRVHDEYQTVDSLMKVLWEETLLSVQLSDVSLKYVLNIIIDLLSRDLHEMISEFFVDYFPKMTFCTDPKNVQKLRVIFKKYLQVCSKGEIHTALNAGCGFVVEGCLSLTNVENQKYVKEIVEILRKKLGNDDEWKNSPKIVRWNSFLSGKLMKEKSKKELEELLTTILLVETNPKPESISDEKDDEDVFYFGGGDQNRDDDVFDFM